MVDYRKIHTMEGIRIISTNSIEAPSNVISDSPQKIHLTPWDLVFLKTVMNQKGLLFQNPINKEDIQIQIQHLKHSLSSTLAFFPPLAGRLVIQEHEENNTASSYILCNNAGALFVHAVAHNTSVADILKPHNNYVPPIVHSLFPLNGVKNYEATSQPLLAVQVSELVDGIFIGCTINHVAADGKSLWHFINSWAEISRGCEKPTKLPSLQRWFMDGVDPPIKFPFTNEEMQHSQNLKPQPPPKRILIFHFTKEKIMQLKSKANAEASCTDKISSLQALLTHVWRSVIRTQQLDPQKETHYAIMVDIRGRIVPPLPECYFGNALQLGVVTMKAGELVEGGVGKGAWEMHKMIASNSDERVKRHCESWLRTPSFFQPGHACGIMVLGNSSSPRFNVYGNDFGWGKPVAVRSGTSNRCNGTITVFAGAEEGSVDLEVCLSYGILEAMENDPEFMDAISN